MPTRIPKRRIIGVQDGVEIHSELPPTNTDQTDGSTIYSRWTSGTDVEFITRRKLTGTVWETGVARGLWANRAALTYAPLELGA